MNLRSLLRLLTAALTISSLALGCQRAPQPSLAEASIPSGFTFANKRPVAVSLSTAAHLLPLAGTAPLQISLEDGTILYRGNARAQQAVSVKLPVPLKEAALFATLTLPHGISRIRLPISAGAAAGSFE